MSDRSASLRQAGTKGGELLESTKTESDTFSGVVYKYTSPNGKVYIGQTRWTLKHRAGKDGNNYRENKLFYRAIKKYGWDNMSVEVIESFRETSVSALLQKLNLSEAHNIQLYYSNDKRFGYNTALGGTEQPFSEIHRLNLSKSRMGMKFSESHKKNMSIETTRRWRMGIFGAERNKKVSIALKGKQKSEEHRKHISEGRKGMKLSYPVWNAKPITHNGKTLSVAGWARELGIKKGTIGKRLSLGWDVAKALETPVRVFTTHCQVCGETKIRKDNRRRCPNESRHYRYGY
jgi:group I intron endonuclease